MSRPKRSPAPEFVSPDNVVQLRAGASSRASRARRVDHDHDDVDRDDDVGVVVDPSEDRDRDLENGSPRAGARADGLELTATERRVAGWLQYHLRFQGAEVFVRGRAGLVLDCLHAGVLVDVDRVLWDVGRRHRRGEQRWIPRAELRNPSGFLRWLVGEVEKVPK